MWERVKLGDIGTIQAGSTPLRAQGARYFATEGIPWVKTGDLNNSKILRTQECITEHAVISGMRVFPAGTVLVAMYGGYNQIGRTGCLHVDASINQAISGIQLMQDRAEPEYVLQFLNHKVDDWKRFAASSRKDPNITRADVAAFQVDLPPLVEQRKIAEILRTWDDAIDAAERTREFMIRRRKAVVDRLVFPSGKPSGLKLGGLPEGWEAQPIGTLAREVSERNSLRETEVILSCSKRLGFVLNEDYFGRRTHSADVSGYKLIRFGQFGFPSNHVEEGSIGLQNLVELAAVSPIYTVFEFGPRVDPGFAFLVFKTEAYRHMFEVSTSASVSRRGSLRWNEFSRLSFPVPSIARQGEIVRAVAAVDTELALLDRKIELLKRQKRGLMQKLLSGEIRVNTDDAHNDEGVGA